MAYAPLITDEKCEMHLMFCLFIPSWNACIPEGQVYTRQTALERQDLACTYLAHHGLESVSIIIMIR